MGQTIELKAADGHTFPAYVAKPAGTPKGASSCCKRSSA
jgi:carboxymethylenebutenolidase